MKYDIQEYGVAPEQEKAELVRRDEAFVHAVRCAIKLGNEVPMAPAMVYGTERPTPFSTPLHISIDNGPNRERLRTRPKSHDRQRAAAERIAAEIAGRSQRKPAIGCFTILDLDADVCSWPSGDIHAEVTEHRFCGLPIMKRGVSYCAPHYRLSRAAGDPHAKTESD